ncbi:MAG: hypothetical protein C0609_08850 [Deltaproteobacteria bacterium]|nr:MAG: hypothetical protein C0609_08850 [Deltaproteobacteria bacterium]
MRTIETVGVVGFGVMGAAIGLNAAMAGYKVVFKEMNDELVNAMYDKWVISALKKRVERGKMTQEQMDSVASLIKGTSNYEDLGVCDLVIEAAVENMDLKISIFGELSKACKKDAVLVSNTSTFLIEKVMSKVEGQERTAGLHYFFPANVNKLVEVIRQKATSDETYNLLMEFASKNGKVAISVKDFPGFAINPVFIAAYAVLDSFYDGGKYNVATLDDISKETLGVRFGVMWVQNGSGLGTAYHAAVSMYEYLGETDIGYPAVPKPLQEKFEAGESWNLEDGEINGDKDARKYVAERLLGAIFAISTQLIEKDVVTEEDLEVGIRTSLAWPKGPFGLMDELGAEETKRLVKIAVDEGYFKLPAKFAA